MAILKISGTIDISQFWPQGQSDADTTKIKLLVGNNAFKIDEKENGQFKVTNVFWNAKSVGKTSKMVVSGADKKITARLQGIDAPELHYKAAPLSKKSDGNVADTKRAAYNAANKDFRECFGESATLALCNLLKKTHQQLIPCTFTTRVGTPNDAVDTYGRFVGDIVVKIGGRDIDINHWLVENGWAVPGLYSTMTNKEITDILHLWHKGRKKTMAKNRTGNAAAFNSTRVFRRGVTQFTIGEDAGKWLEPKFFRRQVAWQVRKKVNLFHGNFEAYMKTQIKDQLYMLNDFLQNGPHSALVIPMSDKIKGNRVNIKMEQVIFKEDPAKLVDKKGKKITKW